MDPNVAYRVAQMINMPHQQIVARAFEKIHGEKISAARMPGASVVGHRGSLAHPMRRNTLRLLTPYQIRLTAFKYPTPHAPILPASRADRSKNGVTEKKRMFCASEAKIHSAIINDYPKAALQSGPRRLQECQIPSNAVSAPTTRRIRRLSEWIWRNHDYSFPRNLAARATANLPTAQLERRLLVSLRTN
ncbi:hypothetical protein ACFQAT_22945 [Undibacterium arcticum]